MFKSMFGATLAILSVAAPVLVSACDGYSGGGYSGGGYSYGAYSYGGYSAAPAYGHETRQSYGSYSSYPQHFTVQQEPVAVHSQKVLVRPAGNVIVRPQVVLNDPPRLQAGATAVTAPDSETAPLAPPATVESNNDVADDQEVAPPAPIAVDANDSFTSLN